ncbi:hypothetical protein FEM48_Zijuj01G0149000 [Ziziphus jujuba var. spinosa]|uniref:(E,E)-geranyllinalool synthase-like n=1 Tax=Ziziphus jujuba var. spinosa TaxID=714518 RepID=A0A978W1X0_ZIZJJ|nr:hypothetical protein FEM48_Zijuj01G0149000 [Ziziphus jujuba var. spinosa]
MEFPPSSIEAQLQTIKETMFSDMDPYSLVMPSAYETAWLAMIPDSHQNMNPMFMSCLNWVLNNQQEEGFWGDCDSHGNSTIECLTSTLACIIALKRWNVGAKMIDKGLEYVHSNAKKHLNEIKDDQCPRWFAIVFPTMVELSQTVGLKIELKEMESETLNQRQRILKTYMIPTTYPMDEELIKLCIINHLHRLGLAEHFGPEIEESLEQFYKNYTNRESWAKPINSIEVQLLKDSLAFRLLRMHGYNVSPCSICWFLCDEKIKDAIQNNPDRFVNVMLNIHRATDLKFSGEHELDEARSFSRSLLQKSISMVGADHDQNPIRTLVEQELKLPWTARLDHLEHRIWIEENQGDLLWRGKTSFQRLSSIHNDKLVLLAKQNYEFRQSIYKKELQELKRWSKDWGLNDMGFGREKTMYCYFAIAASFSLPYDSDVRMIVAKSAILITVADDFFDMEGSLSDLETLLDSIERWDCSGLSNHGKIIFNALDNLVQEMAAKYLQRQGTDITNHIREIWYETFDSWMTESKWSRNERIPSIDEYLKVGMTSIATHTIILPASCFMNPSLPPSKLRPPQYENITKLVMVIARLLNDIQSYQKEKDEGKLNSILLCLEKNPELDVEELTANVRGIIEKKKEEFLEQVLMDGFADLPKPCNQLHLYCLKVFQMFFNSSNLYDSNMELLGDIGKAIYIPLEIQSSKSLLHLQEPKSKKVDLPLKFQNSKPNLKPLPLSPKVPITNCHINRPSNHLVWSTNLSMHRLPKTSTSRNGYWKMTRPGPNFSVCFF